MTYINQSAYWGDVGTEVTPQWYGERALILNVTSPLVFVARRGLVIDNEIVALPVIQEE